MDEETDIGRTVYVDSPNSFFHARSGKVLVIEPAMVLVDLGDRDVWFCRSELRYDGNTAPGRHMQLKLSIVEDET